MSTDASFLITARLEPNGTYKIMKTVILITICLTGTFAAGDIDVGLIAGKTAVDLMASADNTAQVVDGKMESTAGGLDTSKALRTETGQDGARIDGTNKDKKGPLDSSNTGVIEVAKTGTYIFGDARNRVAAVGGTNVGTINTDEDGRAKITGDLENAAGDVRVASKGVLQRTQDGLSLKTINEAGQAKGVDPISFIALELDE